MPVIRKLLVANRGEIAVRVIRTCREMGIETVAVYSEADRRALHVRLADQAIPIGGPAARDSYLNINAIVAAARKSTADAIHPGYGFLAENADFAVACEQAGIIFIGPPSGVIRALGSKSEGRRLALEAGVPVAPSATEKDFSKLGFPILIKASAGGGGRGMRIVRTAAEFTQAFFSARSEAERAFGDGSLLIEKYIEDARHVEIQILGDHHGNLIHLFERDCSVQRRHQKIIEESPSPAVTPELRRRMAEAALALGRKVRYTSAGTVEFLLAPSGEFYFIEVNTRIQVEHPVTELITGLDLLRLQIAVAQGHRLSSVTPQQNGHAIEARLYAEDPARDFLPCTGTLHVWDPPAGVNGLRVDSGVEEGTEIGVYYDPLLAKIIAHAPDREGAINKLVYALRHCGAQGVDNNREFLIHLLDSKEFHSGKIHTGSDIAVYAREDGREKQAADDAVFTAALRAWIERTEHAQRQVLPSIPLRFRNNPYPSRPMIMKITAPELDARASDVAIDVIELDGEGITVVADGVQRHFKIRRHGDEYYIRSDLGQRTIKRMPRYPRGAAAGKHQTANSPMPGQVLRILVSLGQRVKAGDVLVVLEAMKMEQNINATMDGLVAAILVKPGQIVAPGQMLVEIQSVEASHEHANRSAAND
ncbi:MAG TPA: biotin carboxylase N-terminal domain-containing protein [Candidatus Angelobacter sp.]|nr:biotin carboxylase N-terminal domain-containing protein [Candidatus Angelobacter sp.]